MSTDRQQLRLRAVRGAITAAADTPEDITAAAVELLTAVLDRNGVEPPDLVSIVFTATADLTSAYPAAGAHQLGLSDVPLLCAAELNVTGTLPRCIRVLVHLYTDKDYASLRHVYLRGARSLRADLAED